MNRTLVVSPHPDDAEIGCGGMIARLLSKTLCSVAIAVCTGEGDLNMLHSGATVPFSTRRKEQENAAEALGGADLRWLGLAPASKFDCMPQSDFVSAFDALFDQFDTVVLPLPSYNDDHVRVWQAGLAAFRPGRLRNVTLLAYEQPNANCLGPQIQGMFGKRYVPLNGGHLLAKTQAIACHASQMNGRQNSIYSKSGAETQAVLRGSEIGHPFAELLYVVREIVVI